MIRSFFGSLIAVALFGGAANAQYPYYVPYSTYQGLAPIGPLPFSYGMGPFIGSYGSVYGSSFMYSGAVPSFFGMSAAGLFAPNSLPLPYSESSPAPSYLVEVSGTFSASLALQFPAAATVWVNGKELAGKPATDRTITSPAIEAGQDYTFQIKAQWKANGKTYEYKREAKVGPGDRSKLIVLNGTEVKK